jgi:predicted DNA-binding transcriptional regulator YafY
MTAAALAAELEVSVRTIYRDVDSLSAAGVPVYGDAGPDGGYRLVDGYCTRLTGLTGDEAEVVLLGGLPGPAAELGVGSALTGAQLKLMAALPVELRDRARLVRERFYLDAPSWYRAVEPVPHLTAVADAVWQQRSVRLVYRRWKAPTDVTRTVDPFGVVLKAGRWYVVARCDAGVRTYRVDQILALESLGTHFERDADFDLEAHWRGYVDDFQERRYRDVADVRLSPSAQRWWAEHADPVVAAAVERTAEPDGDGWVRAQIPIESIAHAARDLLQLGADLEVLAPAALRDRIVSTVDALRRMYEPALAATG